MRIEPFTILATTLFATPALASDVRLLSLPDDVRGAWAQDADACRGTGEGKIDIDARTHSTPDATCEIAWITVTPSRDGPVYSARSVCTRTETGQKEPPSYFLVSPRPRDELLVRPNGSLDAEPVIYKKCS